jgi:PAS domain S-box-containing protein
MNAPTDSVILMDTQGIILALNETAALRFGRRTDELIGVLADDLLPEEIARSRRALVTQVLEKKQMVRFEDERDGRWYDTVAYPITSGTGEVIKIAIIARDITKRRTI